MTTTEPAETTPAAREVGGPGCIQVVEGDEVLGPLCRAAAQAAIERLSLMESLAASIDSALANLHDQPALTRAILRDAARAIADSDDARLEQVPRDEALIALVESLEQLITTDARSLLEQAITAVDTLTTGGWVLVRRESLQ